MAQAEPIDEQPAEGGATRPTRVVNLRHRRRDPGNPEHVYIGRANGRSGLAASKWANPFKMRSEKERAGVIARCQKYVLREWADLVADLPELRGKTLYCWCAPPGGLTADDRPHVCPRAGAGRFGRCPPRRQALTGRRSGGTVSLYRAHKGLPPLSFVA